jgi:bacterioferritin-associated ferredoxin
MLLCFQIRVNFTLVLCIACYHFEFGIAARLAELTMLGTQCGHCTKHADQVLNQCANKPA